MGKLITIIRHDVKAAAVCKVDFKDDYEMYSSYCSQFRSASRDGNEQESVRIIPIPYAQYKAILI